MLCHHHLDIYEYDESKKVSIFSAFFEFPIKCFQAFFSLRNVKENKRSECTLILCTISEVLSAGKFWFNFS